MADWLARATVTRESGVRSPHGASPYRHRVEFIHPTILDASHTSEALGLNSPLPRCVAVEALQKSETPGAPVITTEPCDYTFSGRFQVATGSQQNHSRDTAH